MKLSINKETTDLLNDLRVDWTPVGVDNAVDDIFFWHVNKGKIMSTVDNIALDCNFDVGQIMAEILCPDYDGTELHHVVDAYNRLPQDIRQDTFDILLSRQQLFARSIIESCIDVINDVGSDDCNLIVRSIRSRFDVDNQLSTGKDNRGE